MLACGKTFIKSIYYKAEKFFFKDFIYIREGKGGKEGNINVWLPLARPLLVTWPTTQACALTGK